MKLIHNYLIDKQLSENEMVRVFRAKDRERQELFTLTVIKDDYQINPDYLMVMISVNENKQSEHPHVAKIIDFGELRQQQYIVSRYAGGKTLSSFLKKPVPVAFAIDVISQLASGLHFLALQGRIHGNINPDNIFFDKYGNAVLSGQEIIPKHADNPREHFSRYCSPEVIAGEAVDIRSDLYSLGVILFELLTSEKFSSRKYVDENNTINVNELVPFLPEDNFGFQPIINKLLAKNPKQRYDNGLELVDALDEYDSRLSHEADFVLDFEDDLTSDSSTASDLVEFESSVMDEFEYGSFNEAADTIKTQSEHAEIKPNSKFTDGRVDSVINGGAGNEVGKDQKQSIEKKVLTSDADLNFDDVISGSQKILGNKQDSLTSLLHSIKQRFNLKRKNNPKKNMFDVDVDADRNTGRALENNTEKDVGALKKGKNSYSSNFDPDIGSYLNTHTNEQIAQRKIGGDQAVLKSSAASTLIVGSESKPELRLSESRFFNKNGNMFHYLQNKKIAYALGGTSALALAIIVYMGNPLLENEIVFDKAKTSSDALANLTNHDNNIASELLLSPSKVIQKPESSHEVDFTDAKETMAAIEGGQAKEVLSANMLVEPSLRSSFGENVDHVASVIGQVIAVKIENKIPPPLITFDDVDVSQKMAIHLSEKVDMLLIKAQGYLSQLKFTTPKNRNAYAMYVAVLNIDPDNSEAKEGVENIAEGYAYMANRQINKENYEKASRYIEKGLVVQGNNEWLMKLKIEVNEWLDVDEKSVPLGTGAEVIAFDGLFE